jgi:hypothetical protein
MASLPPFVSVNVQESSPAEAGAASQHAAGTIVNLRKLTTTLHWGTIQ